MGAFGIANCATRGFMPVGVDLRGRLLMGFVPYKRISFIG